MIVSPDTPTILVRVLAPRRKSREIKVGPIHVGDDAPISMQLMTNTETTDINDTLQQIAELTAAGRDIVRVAISSADDAETFPITAMKSQIPMIADVHFQPRYVFVAIDAGCAAVRANPGNIKQFNDKVIEIARAATDVGVSLRIGVNVGSLDKRLLTKYGAPIPEAPIESVIREASLFKQVGLCDFEISVKYYDPVVIVHAYELLTEAYEYPLHPDVTEAGPAFQGTVESSVAFRALLSEGIGDIIRVFLSVPPAEEVKISTKILEFLNPRPRELDTVSCPLCGCTRVDVYTLVEEVTKDLKGTKAPLRVVVMGCVVNGPGEAYETDLGVVFGDGEDKISMRGEVIKTVPEDQIMGTLLAEAHRIAAEMNEVGEPQMSAS